MPTTTCVTVQLLTRVPYQLRHRAKVHCGPHDTTLRLETTPHADQSAQRAAAR